MYNKEEIERIKLKIIIYKRAYNSYFNQLMVTLIVLFINIVMVIQDHSAWFNNMAVGGLLISFCYIWVNMRLEYADLKFYTEMLHRILMKDEDEIDSLNNLLRLRIYDKDMKNAPWPKY